MVTIPVVGHRIRLGDILLDKYRVERVLGEGGMAVVVAARHLSLDHVVAIKTMNERALTFPDAIERFVQEAQTAVRLRSENVASVTDVGILENGSPYMVMEYLEGVDLASVLHRHGALAIEDAIDFMLQICLAMHEAHQAGVVHRDLKPSNIFLTRRPDGSALIKVLDFGISKVTLDPRTGENAVSLTATNDFGTMGSPPYMSPEQARSAKHVDARTDIWSLGVILYQWTTGQLPFYADNAAETLAKIMYEVPELASDIASWVPRQITRVIERCLEKDPAARYQNIAELALALGPFASADGRRRAESLFSHGGKRRARPGLINRLASFAEHDTEVDASVIVDAPSRLDLAQVFDSVAPIGLGEHVGVGTSQVASGELAVPGASRRSRRRRLLLGALGLVLLGVSAAGIVVYIGAGDDGPLRPNAMPPASAEHAKVADTPASQAQPRLMNAAAVDAGVADDHADDDTGATKSDSDGDSEQMAQDAAPDKTQAGALDTDKADTGKAGTSQTSPKKSTRKRDTGKNKRPRKKVVDPFGTIQ